MKNSSKWAISYYLLRAALKVPYQDLRLGVKLSLLLKLKMWSKGFLSDKYYYYDLAKNDFRLYITDRQRAMTRFINEPYSEILNNKVIFERIIIPYARTPRIYGIIDEKKFISLEDNTEFYSENDLFKSVNFILESYNMVVIKPVKGAFGRGVYIVEYKHGEGYFVNGAIYSLESFNKVLGSIQCSVITEFVRQGIHPSSFYAGSTNTMRVITINPGNHEKPFIAAAVRRVGTDKSSPMDNVSRGGLTIEIDLDSGQLGSAAQLTNRGLIWHEYHPDSGAVIKGVYTPGWEKIKSDIINLTSKLPYIKYIGWDIIETDRGLVFIEGNNHPNVRVNQIHRPLLSDQRMADFYKKHSIV